MELGHWVTGSVDHLGHLSRPGHWVIILSRCETQVFPVFEKMPKNAKRTFEMQIQKLLLTYLPCRVLEYSIRYSTEYSSSKKFDSHTPTHTLTFGVHCRTGITGSTGSLGRWIPRSLGRWVRKCDPVPCLVDINVDQTDGL